MLNKLTLLSILPILLTLSFPSQAQEITKDEMIAYFDAVGMCYSYSPLDVPEMAPKIIKSDSLNQILVGMQEQAQTLPQDELEVLETEFQEVLNQYQMLQDKLISAKMNHCEKLIEQSGLNLTWNHIFRISEALDNKDNEEVLSLHDEVLLERFNALMSNSKTVIEGMDDDTFLTHLSYFVKYIRMQQKVEEAAEAARRGEGSEREAFRMETELADYYQSLISEGKITNEQMEKLNEKINNDIILDELVKALLSDRISLR